MAKKVLSVVLALVLALGVCAVAASAATAADLQTALTKLPSEYNAHFYKDATEALILEARQAAEAALESGSGINEAKALCDQALAAAYAKEEVYLEEDDDYMYVYTNRDESKAVADMYYESDAPAYLMPGDTFNLTVSIKTNFYIRTFQTGFAYDKTKFEPVLSSITFPDANLATLDCTTATLSNTWGYRANGTENAGGFPENWTSATKAQYGLFQKSFIFNAKGTDFFYPEQKTELYTIQIKVKDTAAVDETGMVYVEDSFVGTFQNYVLGSYRMPVILFTRAYAPGIYDTVADLGGTNKYASKVTDQNATCGQTVNFHFDGNLTVNIGEEPVQLDYTKLEAAIASFKAYTAADWTDASWAAFAAAVEAGTDEGLVAQTQEEIDAFEADIIAKREALEAFVQDSEILSITEVTTPVVGTFVTLDVLISCPVNKLQFVNSAGGTATYYKDFDRVLNIVDNADGTQTWTIKIMVYNLTETYNVYAKIGSVWSTKGYRYILADTHDYDSTIYSAYIPDAVDNRVYKGRHDIVVETGLDVLKVQFAYLGTTATFTPDNATVEEKDGRLYWTCNFNFCKADNAIVHDILSRTKTAGFTKTDVSLVVDVLVCA